MQRDEPANAPGSKHWPTTGIDLHLQAGAANNLIQRGPGFPRVIGARADIGAFETNPDRIFANGFE